jgi:hypothetical protein
MTIWYSTLIEIANRANYADPPIRPSGKRFGYRTLAFAKVQLVVTIAPSPWRGGHGNTFDLDALRTDLDCHRNRLGSYRVLQAVGRVDELGRAAVVS